MLIGKKVRLQPNKTQEEAFFKFAGVNRFVWNKGLSFYESVYKDKGEYVNLSKLMHHLQDLKYNDPEYEWLNTVPEAIIKQAMKDLLKAFKAYYKERKQPGYVSYTKKQIEHAARIGRKLTEYDKQNHPKFKKRGKCVESFYQRTDRIHKTDDSHIKITGIKTPVKCTALRGVDLPEHIQNSRITYDSKYWYLSYSYEIDDADVIENPERESLGIDLGIKDLAICSNGKHFRNINKDKRIKALHKRLKKIQRQISRKYEAGAAIDKNGKKIFYKTANIKKLEQQQRLIYRRISNIQKAYMYEVINTVVRTKPQTIVLEDLNVKGMMQNPKLARAVQEQNLSKFRSIMTYKCKQYGIELVLADRWYPSSKTCSNCGAIKKDLKLKDRTYHCEYCGMIMDRDDNASINLEHYPKMMAKSKTA